MANRVLLARDVMIREVHTIHPGERVALARLRMLRHGVGALPVGCVSAPPEGNEHDRGVR